MGRKGEGREERGKGGRKKKKEIKGKTGKERTTASYYGRGPPVLEMLKFGEIVFLRTEESLYIFFTLIQKLKYNKI